MNYLDIHYKLCVCASVITCPIKRCKILNLYSPKRITNSDTLHNNIIQVCDADKCGCFAIYPFTVRCYPKFYKVINIHEHTHCHTLSQYQGHLTTNLLITKLLHFWKSRVGQAQKYQKGFNTQLHVDDAKLFVQLDHPDSKSTSEITTTNDKRFLYN